MTDVETRAQNLVGSLPLRRNEDKLGVRESDMAVLDRALQIAIAREQANRGRSEEIGYRTIQRAIIRRQGNIRTAQIQNTTPDEIARVESASIARERAEQARRVEREKQSFEASRELQPGVYRSNPGGQLGGQQGGLTVVVRSGGRNVSETINPSSNVNYVPRGTVLSSGRVTQGEIIVDSRLAKKLDQPVDFYTDSSGRVSVDTAQARSQRQLSYVRDQVGYLASPNVVREGFEFQKYAPYYTESGRVAAPYKKTLVPYGEQLGGAYADFNPLRSNRKTFNDLASQGVKFVLPKDPYATQPRVTGNKYVDAYTRFLGDFVSGSISELRENPMPILATGALGRGYTLGKESLRATGYLAQGSRLSTYLPRVELGVGVVSAGALGASAALSDSPGRVLGSATPYAAAFGVGSGLPIRNSKEPEFLVIPKVVREIQGGRLADINRPVEGVVVRGGVPGYEYRLARESQTSLSSRPFLGDASRRGMVVLDLDYGVGVPGVGGGRVSRSVRIPVQEFSQRVVNRDLFLENLVGANQGRALRNADIRGVRLEDNTLPALYDRSFANLQLARSVQVINTNRFRTRGVTDVYSPYLYGPKAPTSAPSPAPSRSSQVAELAPPIQTTLPPRPVTVQFRGAQRILNPLAYRASTSVFPFVSSGSARAQSSAVALRTASPRSVLPSVLSPQNLSERSLVGFNVNSASGSASRVSSRSSFFSGFVNPLIPPSQVQIPSVKPPIPPPPQKPPVRPFGFPSLSFGGFDTSSSAPSTRRGFQYATSISDVFLGSRSKQPSVASFFGFGPRPFGR